MYYTHLSGSPAVIEATPEDDGTVDPGLKWGEDSQSAKRESFIWQKARPRSSQKILRQLRPMKERESQILPKLISCQ